METQKLKFLFNYNRFNNGNAVIYLQIFGIFKKIYLTNYIGKLSENKSKFITLKF